MSLLLPPYWPELGHKNAPCHKESKEMEPLMWAAIYPDKTWGFYYDEEEGEIIGGKLVLFATNILFFHGEVLERMGPMGGKEW